MAKASQPLYQDPDKEQTTLISVIIKNVIQALSQVQPLKNGLDTELTKILGESLSRLDDECLLYWSHEIVTRLLTQIKANKSYYSYVSDFTISNKTLLTIAKSTVDLLIEEWIPASKKLALQREMCHQIEAVNKFITAEAVMLHPHSKFIIAKKVEGVRDFSEEAKDENDKEEKPAEKEDKGQEDKDCSFFLLDQFIYLGNLGTVIEKFEYKHKGLNYIEQAYNEVNRLDNTIKSMGKLLIIINIMIEFAKQFGDVSKAALLSKYILKTEAIMRKLVNVSGLDERCDRPEPEVLQDIEPIISCGLTDIDTIEIKNKLRKLVLEPIQKAAAEGKWIDHQYGFVNFGVSGYIDFRYLEGQLGELNNEQNLDIAISLCFEAINIGIMLSDEKNPICSKMFCSTYINIVGKIIDKHPEYFGSGYIFKILLQDPSMDSIRLLGYAIEWDNNVPYNDYFEKAINPFIMERIKAKILDPLALILTDEDAIYYPTMHKKKYLPYFDLDMIKKFLGVNLSSSEDAMFYTLTIIYDTITKVVKYDRLLIDWSVSFFLTYDDDHIMDYVLSHCDDKEYILKIKNSIKQPIASQQDSAMDQSFMKEYILDLVREKNQPSTSSIVAGYSGDDNPDDIE